MINGFDEGRRFGVEIEFYFNKNNRHDMEARREAMERVERAMGIEGIDCQAERYNHYTRPHWKLTTDASVAGEGLELVSPILQGRDGLEQLETVCKVLNQLGAKVNKSCGLHVHHDAGDFELQTFKNLYKLYINYEATIDSLMPESRRGNNNTYCETLRGKRQFDMEGYTTLAELKRNFTNDRYVKLNFEAYRAHGTIEFRQHSGTIEFEKIKSWVLLTQRMVTLALTSKRIRDARDEWETFRKALRLQPGRGADEEIHQVSKFYTKRRQLLAA